MDSLFGSKTSTVSNPEWFTSAAQAATKLAAHNAVQGYVPYQGADVAAQTQGQTDARQNTNNWMAAFGMAPKRDVSADVPAPTTFKDGTKGYSSYGQYTDQLEALKSKYPGLYKYIAATAIDPVAGVTPTPVTPAPVVSRNTYNPFDLSHAGPF